MATACTCGREGGAPSFRFLALLRRVGIKSAKGLEFNEIGGPGYDVVYCSKVERTTGEILAKGEVTTMGTGRGFAGSGTPDEVEGRAGRP